jgi:hypothetical protein
MIASTSKRLFAVFVVFFAFLAYTQMRDSVRVFNGVPKSAVKPILRGLEEWSSPKFFRHIEIEPGRDGTLLGEVREPGGRWSVTVFTNEAGGWKKCGWFLVVEDKANWIRPTM